MFLLAVEVNFMCYLHDSIKRAQCQHCISPHLPNILTDFDKMLYRNI